MLASNGLLMSSGKFKIDGAYLPVTDVLVVDSNGRKVQEYVFERGLLINYLADGSVKDSLHSPLKEAEQNFVEYYTSRVIKKQWNSRKDTGRNGIVFYPFSNNEPRLSFMYQQTGFYGCCHQQRGTPFARDRYTIDRE